MSGIRTPTRQWNGGSTFGVSEDDNTAAILHFDGGVLATLHEAWSSGVYNSAVRESLTFRIHGLEGTIVASSKEAQVYPDTVTLYPAGREPQTMHLDERLFAPLSGGHRSIPNPHVYADILHLLECIEQNRQPLASMYQAQHALHVIEAIYEAARSGATAIVPPAQPFVCLCNAASPA